MKWNNALRDFEHYLKIERGLSNHTVVNYRLDVQKLISYLEQHNHSETPTEIETDHVKSFLYELAKSVNTRTQSRVISGLRSFFDYLIFENYRNSNPLEQIEAPKLDENFLTHFL